MLTLSIVTGALAAAVCALGLVAYRHHRSIVSLADAAVHDIKLLENRVSQTARVVKTMVPDVYKMQEALDRLEPEEKKDGHDAS